MIGYYVHHQGLGHLHRAQTILSSVEQPATILSTHPGPWVNLPCDNDGSPVEPTANGRLHWAPKLHSGLRGRMARIARWIEDTAPTLIVVDVSVEVAVLARSMGVPVLMVAMSGDRSDAPHVLGYDLADALLAPWPAAFPAPDWPSRWRDKTHHVGAFSRYDDRRRLPAETKRVLVLLGAGGTGEPLDVERAAAATPDWRWDWLGTRGKWAQDPWPALCAASVVITHAGQNAVAEVAAARRPAMVMAQRRPHGEQNATADVLARGGLAVVRSTWPRAEQWPSVLAETAALGGDRWSRWSFGDGAKRAARLIDELACAQS